MRSRHALEREREDSCPSSLVLTCGFLPSCPLVRLLSSSAAAVRSVSVRSTPNHWERVRRPLISPSHDGHECKVLGVYACTLLFTSLSLFHSIVLSISLFRSLFSIRGNLLLASLSLVDSSSSGSVTRDVISITAPVLHSLPPSLWCSFPSFLSLTGTREA